MHVNAQAHGNQNVVTETPGPAAPGGAELAFAHELQRHVMRLVRVSELCDRTCVCTGDVTVAQSYALFALPTQSAINMHDLSSAMNLAGSTMTRVVDQLVQKGLAERAPGEDDRRVVMVRLTPEGHGVRQAVMAHFQTVFAQVTARVAEADREPMLRALDEITTSIADAAARCCPAQTAAAAPL
jgi:DNA-binding MarR family transcriptional regulator